MDELHATGKKVLDVIKAFLEKNHYPPTFEEIRVGAGLKNKSHVDYWVKALEASGFILFTPGKPRGIELLT